MNRIHLGIFGRRNNGKSSLINKITGQDIAIVSDIPGTTTDPVRKNIEIFGLGAVTLIDTAGIDDGGTLGQQRVEKSLQTMKEIDAAVVVIAQNTFSQPEADLIHHLKDNEIPFLIVHNKADLESLNEATLKQITSLCDAPVIDFSARNDVADQLLEAIKSIIPSSALTRQSLLGGLVKQGDTVVLVCPIDAEAPEGRMIMPQVMAIRDALDNNCICVVVKETQLADYLHKNPHPDLVVTDSQVFGVVNKVVSANLRLTSFSIPLARFRGDYKNYLVGTPHLSNLYDGDIILMLESCTHQVNCEDIGRVKLPRMIRQFTGKDLKFEYVSGLSPIENIQKYALVIQCGGCMVTQRQLRNRTDLAVKAGVPITNYGMSIAYMTGIFDRVTNV